MRFVNKFFSKHAPRGEKPWAYVTTKKTRARPEIPGLGKPGKITSLRGVTSPISSLNEAWFHTLDNLLQNGHGPKKQLRIRGFRYCWLRHGRAAVVTPRALH